MKIVFSILTITYFLCGCSTKDILKDNIHPQFDFKLFDNELLLNANKFIQSKQISGYISQEKDSIIITQIIEGPLPADTTSFEKNVAFPFAIEFSHQVLKAYVLKNKNILHGSVIIRFHFYVNTERVGELEFKYFTYLLTPL